MYSIKNLQLPDITIFQLQGFHSDDLFALQKKAVRVVANRPYDD